MAYWLLGISLALLIFSIFYQGYTSKGIKAAHYIATVVIIGGLATLYKELKSSDKTDDIKSTGEKTNLKVLDLEKQNTNLRIQLDAKTKEIGDNAEKYANSSAESQRKLDENQRKLNEKTQDVISLQAGQIIEQKKLNQKSEQIIALNDEHKKTLQENVQLSSENVQLSKDLAKAYEKAQILTQEKLDNILGKNSYCYITIDIPRDKSQDLAIVTLHNGGQFQLENLEISLINTDEEYERQLKNNVHYNDNPKEFYRVSNPYTKSIPLLKVGQIIRLDPIKFVRRSQKSFNVFFKTSRDNWYQRIVLRDLEFYLHPSAIYQDMRYSFIATSQVYNLSYTAPNARLYHFEETLKILGLVAVDTNDESYQKSPSSYFPLLKGEKIPFKEIGAQELHWDSKTLITSTPILPVGTGKRR